MLTACCASHTSVASVNEPASQPVGDLLVRLQCLFPSIILRYSAHRTVRACECWRKPGIRPFCGVVQQHQPCMSTLHPKTLFSLLAPASTHPSISWTACDLVAPF